MQIIDNDTTKTALAPVGARAVRIARIKANARRLLERDKAANTLAEYESAWTDFQEFCKDFRVTPLPVSVENLAAYLSHLSEGQTLSTIRVKLSAVGYYHRKAGQADPTDSERISSLMNALARDKGEAPNGKEALSLAELGSMTEVLPHTLRGCRDRALLLLGFAGAFRRSELTALDVSDLEFDAQALTVKIRRSKTDQTGKGNSKVIPRLDGRLDPVRAMQTWLSASGIVSGPVFRPVDKWEHLLNRRLSAQMVRIIVQKAASEAGIQKDLSAHSLRSGFVTTAAKDGVPMEDIRKVTLHKTFETLKRYDQAQATGQVRAIRKAFGEHED